MLKINLIIDGNYTLMKSVFMLDRLRTLYGDLETLLLRDYNNISNVFQYDMIYFVSDSKTSWRKISYPEYKDGRKKDLKIDWNFVFETYESFKETITARNNCLVYTIDPFEGDDIIAHIITESNKEGYSNLIISNDADIHQFLKFSTADNWINIQYNHKFNDERLYVPKNYNLFFNHIEENSLQDIFDLNDDQEFVNHFDKLKNKCKLIEIDSEQSYFTKIVAGDKGDNIVSIAKFDNEMRGIGKAGAETIWKMYKEKYPDEINFDDDLFIENLTDILSIYKKNKDTDFRNKLKENIIFTRKLTRLDARYLPNGMKEILKNNIKI